MTKLLMTLLASWLTTASVYAQSADRNYTVVLAPRYGTTNLEAVTFSSSVADVQKSIRYTDGLGRTVQSIVRQGSPSQKDLVQVYEYDGIGRQAKSYLPYASTSSTGAFQSNNTTSFYSSPPSGVVQDAKPFSLSTYESSPLNRPLTTTGPGQNWHNASKKLTYVHRTNTSSDAVDKLRVGSGSNDTPTTGTYAAGELSVVETLDENNNKMITFTNKLGQVVQKNVQSDGTWLLTKYVYDDFGKLRFIIPPKAVAVIGGYRGSYGSVHQTTLDELAFKYVYDARQRVILEKKPGTDPTEMIYDRRDRVVLSRNGAQASRGEWSFIKYDALNRPIMTGIYPSTQSRSELISAINAKGYAESRTNSSVGYTLNSSFPVVTEANLRTITYYDNYTYLSYTGWDQEGFTYTFTSSDKLTSPTNQITGTKTRVIGSNKWLNSVSYYDRRYRPIYMISENHRSGTDKISNTYNFIGNLLQTQRIHSSSNLTITEAYSYDHANRLNAVTHKINNESPVTVSQLNYNELGELVERNLFGKSANLMQSIDYRYNIRGWLRNINNSALEHDVSINSDPAGQPTDLFGAEFSFEQNSLSLPTP